MTSAFRNILPLRCLEPFYMHSRLVDSISLTHRQKHKHSQKAIDTCEKTVISKDRVQFSIRNPSRQVHPQLLRATARLRHDRIDCTPHSDTAIQPRPIIGYHQTLKLGSCAAILAPTTARKPPKPRHSLITTFDPFPSQRPPKQSLSSSQNSTCTLHFPLTQSTPIYYTYSPSP